MKALWILAGLCFMGVFGISVLAQDETQEITCTPAEWAEFVPELIEILNSISTSEDPLADILLVDTWLATTRTICTGGVWTSEEYGTGASVIGPVVFGGTLYQGTLTSEDSALVSLTAFEGDCDSESLSVLYSKEEGNPPEDTTLFEFENCVAYFEVDGYGDPWSLSIVRLK